MVGRTFQHYRIESKLGEGGMGVVYKALDTHLNRAVAIKLLAPEAVADPARQKRFVQEARAASAIDHPNIVTIHDIAEVDGQHFIVMQYVEGKTLRGLLERGALPLADALRYAIQIADALAQAHARGIVHRDLKPENVMVNEQGQVKILDFGLAKLAEARDPQATLTEGAEAVRTEEGRVLGTAAYMSPEQALGNKVDWRTDIFAFGSLLYEMVTGRRAFEGQNRLELLSAVVKEEPPKVSSIAPQVPAELGKLIERALRKDPERRWQSMADIRVALTELKEESGSGSAPAVPADGSLRRRPWWVTAAAVGLALVAGVVVWHRWPRPQENAPAPSLRAVPFTSFPGLEVDPAASPNGDQVAFAWNGERGDNFDIYVQLIGAGAPLRLTQDPAEDFGPAWSPDGRQIAFYRGSEGGRDVLVVPALGGPERNLGRVSRTWFDRAWVAAPVHTPPAWSPDGKLLAVVDRSSPREPDSLFALSMETRARQRLTSPPADSSGDAFPAFSPDGKSLAFIRFFSVEANDIYVQPLGPGGALAGEARRITFNQRIIWGLAWTPDGRNLVFSSDQTGTRSLMTIPLAAPGATPQRASVGAESAFSPSISARGLLVYARREGDTDIWALDLRSPSHPSTRLISSTRSDASPQFSPDGKRIAFASARSGSQEIWACDSDGSNPMQLTSFNGPPTGSPRWSPDGQWVAFDSLAAGNRDVYVVSIQGGQPRRLTTEDSEDTRASWSRDGKWIYFGSNRSGAWQVWKVPPDGGTARQITRQGGREAFEAPDGRFVFYHKRDVPGIWRVPSEGGEEVQVVASGLQGHWAVTGDGIYFLDPAPASGPKIEFFSFASQRLTPVADLDRKIVPTAGFGTPAVAVSADGRRLLYIGLDHIQSDLMLVENFQ